VCCTLHVDRCVRLTDRAMRTHCKASPSRAAHSHFGMGCDQVA
jgi:hypothetical protein